MSMDFGKLNFAVGFNRTSAFPLDANSYFEDYSLAVEAAASAAEVGSSDSAYYVGQILIVNDKAATNKGLGLYQITSAKTLVKFGQASSADELGERVSALEGQITVINGKLILATSEADGLLSKEDFSKLAGIEEGAQVNVIEGVKVDGVNLQVTDRSVNIDLSSALEPYAKSTDVTTALNGKVDAVEGKGLSTNDYDDDAVSKVAKIDGLETTVAGHTESIQNINAQLVGLTGAMHFVGVSTTDPATEGATVEEHDTFKSGDVCLFGNKEYVYNGTSWIELGDEGSHLTKTEAANTYLTKTDAADTYITATKAAEDITTAKNAAIEAAGTAADTKISTALEAYTTTEDLTALLNDKANADDLQTLTTTVGENTTSISGLTDRITDLEAVGAEANYVKSVDSEFTVTEEGKLTLNTIAQSKVTGLADALDGKVDKVEGWTLLSPTDQEKLNALVIGEGGGVEISGKVNAANVEGLGDWITSNRDSIGGLLSADHAAKLTGIEDGAEVNKIDTVKINGEALDITSKSVNIPVASGTTFGVVLSSSDENKVSVKIDGSMEVNSISVNKLYQAEGDTLILNGGNA